MTKRVQQAADATTGKQTQPATTATEPIEPGPIQQDAAIATAIIEGMEQYHATMPTQQVGMDMEHRQQLIAAAGMSVTMDAKAERIQKEVDAIKAVFDGALSKLVKQLNEAYARKIAGLELEAQLLSKKHARVEQNQAELEVTLPADRRLTQHEADQLLFSGRPTAKEDAAAKLAEFEESTRDMLPDLTKRLKEITARIQAIQQEKRAIARTVFNEWHVEEMQPVVRAIEHGLFLTLLNGLEQAMYQFQDHSGTGISTNRERPLLNQGHIAQLTADERSAEFQSGRRWYGGRR